MGSQLVEKGTVVTGGNYRIFKIDNVYTVYLQMENQLDPDSGEEEPLYSAVKSYQTKEEAQEYIRQLSLSSE